MEYDFLQQYLFTIVCILPLESLFVSIGSFSDLNHPVQSMRG